MGDIRSSYSSETSPGSTETLAEAAPLLTAATSPNTDIGYKTITTATTSERLSNEENGLVEEENFREGDPKSKNVFAIIGLLLIGVFVSNADATLVIATYASISSEFGALKNAAWLTTSYTLAICAVQGIVGKLSDIYGRKAVLLVSYVGFAFGSVLTGMSQSMWQAVAGRVVSGLGGAGMVVIVSVLITDLVPLIEVATWRSYVNVLATLGRSTGGPLGGFLADTVGWRWSFIGQGPLFLLAFVLICLKLPSQLPTQHSQIKGQPSKLRRIDFIGAILLALSIVTFLSALSLGSQDLNWIDPLILSLAAASSVLGSLFILWEIKFAFEPIFPPALVIQRDVATSYAISAFQTGAQVSMLFSVPLYFRITTNASNTQAGAYLFPSVLGNAIGGIIAGYVIRRTAKYKTLIVLATLSSCVSYFLLIVRWHENISIWEVLETFPGGFGTGIVGSGIFIALTSSVEHKDIAMATGGMYLGSAFGMMTGIAVSTSVQLTSLRWLLVERLQGPGSERIISSVISDISTISSLAEPIQKVVVESYVKSLEYSHVVSFSSAVAAFLLSLTIREHPLR